MTKVNQIRTQDKDKDFRVFEKDERSSGFVALTMEIAKPSSVKLDTITYSSRYNAPSADGMDSRTVASFGIHLDNDVETLKNLVKWTKNITRQANKQIKKLEK